MANRFPFRADATADERKVSTYADRIERRGTVAQKITVDEFIANIVASRHPVRFIEVIEALAVFTREKGLANISPFQMEIIRFVCTGESISITPDAVAFMFPNGADRLQEFVYRLRQKATAPIATGSGLTAGRLEDWRATGFVLHRSEVRELYMLAFYILVITGEMANEADGSVFGESYPEILRAKTNIQNLYRAYSTDTII